MEITHPRMCIENSLLSASYIFTFIETIKYISFHLKIPFQRIFSTLSEKHIGNTISFNIIGGLDSAAQFLAASCQQSPDIDLRLKLDKRQSEEGFS